METLEIVKIGCEVPKGMPFNKVCRSAILLAIQHWCVIEFEFNEKQYRCNPDRLVEQVLEVKQ